MAYVKSQHYAAWRQIAQCSWARLEAKHEELACSTHDHRLICYLMLTDPSAVHTQRKSLMSHSISNRSVRTSLSSQSFGYGMFLYVAQQLFVFIILRFIFHLHLMYVGAFCRLLNKQILHCWCVLSST